MKIAISIPDDLFADAERLAEQLQTSRSGLYCRALRDYLARHATDEVTTALDRVVEAIGDDADSFASAAARARLGEVEW